ncbi:MAG: hypothetical protein K2P27_13835 [Lachnospiraceae bacterium]|nr:hypothetical protein [Lachnospiraceae bacterium]
MRWYRNLYLGTNAAPRIQKIRKKASEGTWMAGVYYLTLTSASGGLLDIFHNGMLKNSLFEKNQCLDVVGVAEGRMEAFRLAGQILAEVYGKTGGFDVRSSFGAEDFVED